MLATSALISLAPHIGTKLIKNLAGVLVAGTAGSDRPENTINDVDMVIIK
jgi:hypothetical protein